MRIGLDFDGVISDAGKLKSDVALRRYGLEIPPEKFKRELVVGAGHLTDEQYTELLRSIYQKEDIAFLMELVAECDLHINKLLSDGHTIVVISSRSQESIVVARKWAQMQGLDLEFVSVYGEPKAAIVQEKGCDVFVDDDLDKLEPLRGIVPHLFLFGWKYNQHVDVDGIATRVNSWRELYEQISLLAGAKMKRYSSRIYISGKYGSSSHDKILAEVHLDNKKVVVESEDTKFKEGLEKDIYRFTHPSKTEALQDILKDSGSDMVSLDTWVNESKGESEHTIEHVANFVPVEHPAFLDGLGYMLDYFGEYSVRTDIYG